MEKLNLFDEEIRNYLTKNSNPSLGDISGIAKWNKEYPDKAIDLETKEGAHFLIPFYSLATRIAKPLLAATRGQV
jgi:hypothetical protein